MPHNLFRVRYGRCTRVAMGRLASGPYPRFEQYSCALLAKESRDTLVGQATGSSLVVSNLFSFSLLGLF